MTFCIQCWNSYLQVIFIFLEDLKSSLLTLWIAPMFDPRGFQEKAINGRRRRFGRKAFAKYGAVGEKVAICKWEILCDWNLSERKKCMQMILIFLYWSSIVFFVHRIYQSEIFMVTEQNVSLWLQYNVVGHSYTTCSGRECIIIWFCMSRCYD